jgi:choline kinase
MHDAIEKEVDNVTFIHNPFYEVTNSIASLWFAKEYLNDNNITIINGDIVMEDNLVKNIVCKEVKKPEVLIDSSIKYNGDYNVQVNGDKILVMSKELSEYYGEYAGITKLDGDSARILSVIIQKMVSEGMYDQWYENALDQLIFNEDFELYYEDISEYRWTEVDCVSDMLLAKQIHLER